MESITTNGRSLAVGNGIEISSWSGVWCWSWATNNKSEGHARSRRCDISLCKCRASACWWRFWYEEQSTTTETWSFLHSLGCWHWLSRASENFWEAKTDKSKSWTAPDQARRITCSSTKTSPLTERPPGDVSYDPNCIVWWSGEAKTKPNSDLCRLETKPTPGVQDKIRPKPGDRGKRDCAIKRWVAYQNYSRSHNNLLKHEASFTTWIVSIGWGIRTFHLRLL